MIIKKLLIGHIISIIYLPCQISLVFEFR